MKKLLTLLLIFQSILSLHALVINEVMSNPTGDDSGREWVEVYNNTDSDVDIAALTISIKGAAFVPVTPVSGGTTLSAHGYGIIGSTVSGATKFMQDYPLYTGPLLKSAIGLVNTGVTSLELKLQGTVVDTLSSYTAAKEGYTYSLVNGSFTTGTPTPGEENKALLVEEEPPTTVPQSGNQTLLPRASPPAADITLYLPTEKTVVAGAPTLFSVFSTTQSGKMLDSMSYSWAFGDGGQSTGSTTLYRYLYPGRYIAQVEGTNGLIAGTGRMMVRVVSPDIAISPIHIGKYGPYIDITNPNNYDLDISFWKITIDGVPFSFPKNTLLTNGVTHFPGSAMGFASTTVSSSTIIKLLFQNMDEVAQTSQGGTLDTLPLQGIIAPVQSSNPKVVFKNNSTGKFASSFVQATKPIATSTEARNTTKKDVRLASFIKSLFGK